MKKFTGIAATLLAALLIAVSGRMAVVSAIAANNDNDEVKRIQESITVLNELNSTPDKSIPRNLLDRAEGIVVIPSLVKGGFIIGAKHGKGVMSTRDTSRGWSTPGFVTMSGGSIGWQIGVESVDLVLLVMNKRGVDDLVSDKFTIGGAMSLAAGPVGRSADAGTDAKLNSQILAYSRTKGLFAGATLEGASLHADKDGNASFYGKGYTLRELITMPSVPGANTESVRAWHATLRSLTGTTEPIR